MGTPHRAGSGSSQLALQGRDKGLEKIDEETIIRAFFLEVPKPFKGLMTGLMDEVGFDYKKYGLS